MTINRNNFEAYLLDYLEGNLDPLLTADLMAFLAENPEYEKYVPEGDNPVLSADNLMFSQKEQLKKDFPDIPVLTKQNFEEFCIAFCEGILSDYDVKRLRKYISENPGSQKELDIYQKIRLQPDLTIKFTDKSTLKKHRKGAFGMRYVYYGLAVAASISLLILLLSPKQPSDFARQPIAVNQSTSESVNKESSSVIKADPEIKPSVKTTTFKTLPSQHTDQLSEFNREAIALETLKPLPTPALHQHIKPAMTLLSIPTEVSVTEKKEPQINPRNNEGYSESLIGTLIAKVDFWKTAETAISSFNYLTESQISVSKTTDGDGNITRLRVNTERYSITGKMR
jgi:hypothetical protein